MAGGSEKLVARIDRVFARLRENLWVPALVARLAMAGEFVPSGFGKLRDIPKLAAYFAELGIFAPSVTATVTATTEFIGGLLLLVGLGTRFAAAALTGVMTVALLTAKLKEAHSLGDFFYLSEPCYIVIFLWLVFYGGGRVSLDFVLARRRKVDAHRRPL